MLVVIALITCFIVLLTIYFRILSTRYSYFEQRGIPTPAFGFFYGNYKSIWSSKQLTRQLQLWTQQYGSIYGLYLGTRPMYVVSDVNFLQEVFIKQFSSFHSRRVPFIMRKSRGKMVHLLGASGDIWHRQRHILNPAFTSAKLKGMTPTIYKCIDSLMVKLGEQHEDFNIYMLYKRLTMDVICHCGFGVITDMQNDIDNEYLKKGEEAIAANLDDHPLIRLGNLIPWLRPVLVYVFVVLVGIQRILHHFIKSIEENPRFWFIRRLTYLVDLRKTQLAKNDGKVPVDLLQLLLDAGEKEANGTNPNPLKSLHSDEIVSNIMLFMVAGYETTSTALAYSSYVLAREPKVQKKLQEELDLHQWDEHEYEEVMKIPYLEWFVNEVLRMFPIAPLATSRECNTTSVICGHTIEAGSVIQADMYTIHYDPDLWGPEDPNKFIPERHAVPRHPMAFMPFGLGPRNCIGKRLALMEIKMCLARLLRHYSIYPAHDMEEKFHLKDTLFILQPTGVYVKIEKRSSSFSSE